MATDLLEEKEQRAPGGVTAKGFWPILLRILGYVVVTATALTMMIPFLLMLATSVKPLSEVQSGHFLPQIWKFGNYLEVIKRVPFGRYYFNSVFIALWVTFGQVLTSAAAAYAF